MTVKTPAEKMRLKKGMSAAFLHVPAEITACLGVPEGVTLVDDPALADFLLLAATTQAEAEERLSAWRTYVTEQTTTWIAYPKGSKAAGRDVSRDTIWRFVATIGLVLVANVAIDETWSALRIRPAG